MTAKPVRWKLKIEHLMACNCNWGCPCSFESPPTYGICETAGAYRIAEGRYGDLVMDGLKWAHALSWPGPLHELNGHGVVYLDETATGTQREALEAIATGQAGGPIGVFMGTVTAGLEVRIAGIDFHHEGENSWFRVPGELEVSFEAIRNPITGEEHFATALLPGGMLTRREDFYSARDFSVTAGDLDFSHPRRNAIAFRHNWRGP